MEFSALAPDTPLKDRCGHGGSGLHGYLEKKRHATLQRYELACDLLAHTFLYTPSNLLLAWAGGPIKMPR